MSHGHTEAEIEAMSPAERSNLLKLLILGCDECRAQAITELTTTYADETRRYLAQRGFEVAPPDTAA